MSDLSETFFTSIGCMDGRSLRPVGKFGKKKFDVLYMDSVTEAGLVGLIAAEDKPKLLEAVRKKIMISLEKHHSKGIIVHGHQECAGNPVDDKMHIEDIKKTARIIKSIVPQGTPIIPVFVIHKENDWEATEL